MIRLYWILHLHLRSIALFCTFNADFEHKQFTNFLLSLLRWWYYPYDVAASAVNASAFISNESLDVDRCWNILVSQIEDT